MINYYQKKIKISFIYLYLFISIAKYVSCHEENDLSADFLNYYYSSIHGFVFNNKDFKRNIWQPPYQFAEHKNTFINILENQIAYEKKNLN